MPMRDKAAPVAKKTPGPEVQRSDPWKEDGNIVLSVQGKHFRVHRSVLSAHSEVFKDMFDCPHTMEAEKKLVEGCPVVQLYDSAADVQMILNALYDRGCPLPFYEKMPFPFVSAFLRLGEKYAISTLVKEAKAKLCCAMDPTSMTSFRAGFLQKLSTGENWLFPAITGGDPHNFQIMNLLQEMELKAPLPIAMYRCVMHCPLSDVVDGYEYAGGWCSLSPANIRSFVRMKDTFETFRMELVKAPSMLCCGVPSCRENIRRVWPQQVFVAPPFDRWDWELQFCEGCHGHLKGKREAAMTKAWEQVPKAFGFNSWAKVKSSGDFPSLTIRTQ